MPIDLTQSPNPATRLNAILAKVGFLKNVPYFRFEHTQSHGRYFVKLVVDRPDAHTGEMELSNNPWRELPLNFNEDQIVRMLFGMCLDFVEHEIREGFLYGDKAVFGPHISVQALMEAADHTS